MIMVVPIVEHQYCHGFNETLEQKSPAGQRQFRHLGFTRAILWSAYSIDLFQSPLGEA
jgi:hypothetical protein